MQPANDTKRARAFWGMQRTLVQNLVTGVTEGFTKKLLITGVGYRAERAGQEPEAAARLQPRRRHRRARGHRDQDARTRPRSRSRASTSRRSASSPPRSVAGASPSRTRARASSTTASSSSARKGRRSNDQGSLSLREAAPAHPHRAARACRQPSAAVGASLGPAHLCAGDRRRRGQDASLRPRRWKRTCAARPARPSTRRTAVGKRVAEAAKAAGVTQVVFDRGGFLFHGRVKALADAAREGGLEF